MVVSLLVVFNTISNYVTTKYLYTLARKKEFINVKLILYSVKYFLLNVMNIKFENNRMVLNKTKYGRYAR
jgi:hypothetical protein